MCNLNKKNDGRRIDPCMKEKLIEIERIGRMMNRRIARRHKLKIVACCCGHGKYPETVIVQNAELQKDLRSGVYIPRKVKFYKKDKQGYYFIPEVIEYKEKVGR